MRAVRPAGVVTPSDRDVQPPWFGPAGRVLRRFLGSRGRTVVRSRLVLAEASGLVLAITLTLAQILGPALPVQAQPADPPLPQSGAAQPLAAGSVDVAPVHILGIPAISVAAPVIGRGGRGPDARQRAAVIEGNLSLLYQPHALCTPGEGIAESLLEGVLLGGPNNQLQCSGDPWAVLGRPGDLQIVVSHDTEGSVVLQARLKGRQEALPLLSVTDADGRLHGLSRDQLAARWQQLLQRRLRHARRTLEPDQIALRLRVALLVALVLAASSLATFSFWSRLRRRMQRHWEQDEERWQALGRRARIGQWLQRLLFVALLAQLVVFAALMVSAIPGQIPLAITLLLQPLSILFKLLLMGLVALVLRQLAVFVLRQWVGSLSVPPAERARRLQRYQNLRQVSRRLIDGGCLVVLAALVLADVPGVRELTLVAWLAGGALLGGLAIAFQGLLRDGVAGLVALLDDHYAVGDVVEVDGMVGEVVDVGLLMTELRSSDQRVVLFANGSPRQLVNHTKIRSGIEVLIPLAEQPAQLEHALAVVASECGLFAADPRWSAQLLAPPWLRGVKRVAPGVIELSVMLTTRTGRQWEAQRELLERLVRALQGQGVVLASGAGSGV
ncbi:MAG: mechanosensitive ion channel family protein [Cyanobium sp.]